MRKLISIALLVGLTSVGGCRLVDALGRLNNIPEHCSVVNVDGENWLELSGGCIFDNPFEVLN